jgi:protease IV
MWGELKGRVKGDPARVSIEKYAKVDPGTAKTKIALLIGEGDIIRGDADDTGAGEAALTSYGFNKLLKTVEGDAAVKGVIVRINSPGGEVSASDEMWRQMNLLSKKKPVVISMSDLAASGGYYMAMTGDPIVAYPQTETGSIGVVFGKPNLKGLYDKLGVNKDAVQRGRHAGIDSDYTQLSDEERAILRNGIDESYHDFLQKVADARRQTVAQIDAVAQGRVWLGSQAKDHGLVDELGGLETALAAVRKKANIPAGEAVSVVTYPARRSIFDVLLRRSQEDAIEAKLASVFGRVPFHAWMKGGYLRILPQWVTVQ